MKRPDVDFFYVYIEEAHPVNGWITMKGDMPLDDDPMYWNKINESTTLDQRIETATKWHADSGLSLKLLIDDPKTDAMSIAFAARPDRLYIIHHGKVLFQGGEGPFGYSVNDMVKALDALN